MASLTITIGPITATVNADNTKAGNVVSAYGDAIGATGTNQEKLQTVAIALVRHMREEAHRHRSNITISQAMADLQAELDQTDWVE